MARFGHLELCKLLVSGGAGTTIVNKEGQDAHATALGYGKPDVAAFLEECKRRGCWLRAPFSGRANRALEKMLAKSRANPSLA